MSNLLFIHVKEIALNVNLAFRVTNLTILIEEVQGTTAHKNFYDVKVLQAATSLKRLRIMVVSPPVWHDPAIKPMWARFLKDILQRVPLDCEVTFGAKTAAHATYIADNVARRKGKEASVDGKVLEDVAKMVEKKGWMSGSKMGSRFVRDAAAGETVQ